MTQAMSHYRYPSHTIKAIPQYSYTNDYLDEEISVTVPGLPNNLFIDWDNMLDLYDDEHPHSPVEDTAVANLMMYVGSAGLMMPLIQKARNQESGVMGICAAGAGLVLAIGIGNVASNILNKTIDKVVDFWDDVKPSAPAKKSESSEPEEEAEENG